MPKKIRELKKMLQKAGFQQVPDKGSHTNWIHPLYFGKVTISGKDGSDRFSIICNRFGWKFGSDRFFVRLR